MEVFSPRKCVWLLFTPTPSLDTPLHVVWHYKFCFLLLFCLFVCMCVFLQEKWQLKTYLNQKLFTFISFIHLFLFEIPYKKNEEFSKEHSDTCVCRPTHVIHCWRRSDSKWSLTNNMSACFCQWHSKCDLKKHCCK